MAWKKGQSGNPAGRPNTKPIKDELIRTLKLPADDNRIGKNKLQRMVISLVSKAIDGDTAAIKEVFDRVEGRAEQRSTVDANVTSKRPSDLRIEDLAAAVSHIDQGDSEDTPGSSTTDKAETTH